MNEIYYLVIKVLIKIKNRCKIFLRFYGDPYYLLFMVFLQPHSNYWSEKIHNLLLKCQGITNQTQENINYEIHGFIYYPACERMITPVIQQIASYIQQNNLSDCKVFVTRKWQNNPHLNIELNKMGCQVILNFYHICRLCIQPNKSKKIVILCCDHQLTYNAHKRGVDIANTLRRFGVNTVSIQHGGSNPKSLEAHASFASDFFLVWGKYSFHQLVTKYNVESSKLRLVGNPNLDQCLHTHHKEILNLFSTIYPQHYINSRGKLIVLLATSIYRNPYLYMQQAEYEKYIRCLYDSIDFSQVYLIIKMHPTDRNEINLYKKLLHPKNEKSILIIEPNERSFNTYYLLKISNLIITLASTVAEEAMLLKIPVLAFDLYSTGPSNEQSFLEKYSLYQRFVWESNPDDLSNKILQLAYAHKSNHLVNEKIYSQLEEDLTYKLDGCSSMRAASSVMSMINYPKNG